MYFFIILYSFSHVSNAINVLMFLNCLKQQCKLAKGAIEIQWNRIENCQNNFIVNKSTLFSNDMRMSREIKQQDFF